MRARCAVTVLTGSPRASAASFLLIGASASRIRRYRARRTGSSRTVCCAATSTGPAPSRALTSARCASNVSISDFRDEGVMRTLSLPQPVPVDDDQEPDPPAERRARRTLPFPAGHNAAAEAAVAALLDALGRDTADPHLADTPRRVVAALEELLTPRPTDWTTFPNDDGYSDLVLVRDIPFSSLCAHHLLPFRGVATIGYVPGTRILGLSKLARGLEHFARDLQLQERLTAQTADWLEEVLDPMGVGVVLEAEHLCMWLRGVQATGSSTRTAAFRGVLASPGPLREGFAERSHG